MQGKGVVFVTGDHLGEPVAALLEEVGCQVSRGPEPNPPALTTFPPDEWPRLLGETTVPKRSRGSTWFMISTN